MITLPAGVTPLDLLGLMTQLYEVESVRDALSDGFAAAQILEGDADTGEKYAAKIEQDVASKLLLDALHRHTRPALSRPVLVASAAA